MFCKNCGKELEKNWKVCPKCGEVIGEIQDKRNIIDDKNSVYDKDTKQLEEINFDSMEKRKRNIRVVLKLLAIVAFVCYFCPLYMVSCAGQEVGAISGFDLTFGFQAMGEKIDGNWFYGIIAVFPLLWFGSYSHKLGVKSDIPYLGPAYSGSLLLLVLYISSMMEERASTGGMLVITSCIALTVLEIACFLSTGLGGYLAFLEEMQNKTKETLDIVWTALKCIGKTIGLSLLIAALVLWIMQSFPSDKYEELMQDTDYYDSSGTNDDLETLDVGDIDESQDINQDDVEEEQENIGQEVANQITEEPQNEDTEFIFPNSSSQYLSVDELFDLPKETLRIGRNEIFARHGYIFKDESLQNYFNSTSWYEGTVKGEDFNMEEEFNEFEKENAELIKSIEDEKE